MDFSIEFRKALTNGTGHEYWKSKVIDRIIEYNTEVQDLKAKEDPTKYALIISILQVAEAKLINMLNW